jgi:hypothetical protein
MSLLQHAMPTNVETGHQRRFSPSSYVRYSPNSDNPRTALHVRKVPIGDMLAKARIRAHQWSFICARRKAVGGEPFAGGPRQTTAIAANGDACRADRATPIGSCPCRSSESCWSFSRSLRRY